MQIILHIGTDKTGSTAIQNTLSQNRPWFLSHSVYIPNTGFGRANGHALLLNKLDPAELQSLAVELKEAEQTGYRAALLSWEGMNKFKPSQIRLLHKALPSFPIRVLVYLREQAEVLQSGHLQWVKMEATARSIRALAQPNNFLERVAASLFLRHPGRNYFKILSHWQKCIPDASFAVRVFDKNKLLQGDIVTDFLGQLELKPDKAINLELKITNPSVDVEGALLIQSWRKDPEASAHIEALIDVTQSVISVEGMSNKYFLDQDAVQTIRANFRASNEKLAKHFMGSAAYPFSEDSQCWRTVDFPCIQARQAELLAKVNVVNEVPTLDGIAHGGEMWSQTDLSEGWSKPEDWGAWSVREQSKIRFRLFSRRIIGEVDALRIKVFGRYYGDNESTEVVINDINFGWQDLSLATTEFVIPLGALGPYESIEIALQHQNANSPFELEGKKDNRPLAFAMTAVGYTLIAETEI